MNRYVLQAEKSEIEELFGIDGDRSFNFQKNFNIQPGFTVPIIVEEGGIRKMVAASWGVQGGDNVGSSIPFQGVQNNEKLQELAKKNACIVPASGFYKWKETVQDPLPFYLRVLSKNVLPVAGVYRKDDDGYSFAVLTMPANALVEPLDKSMPCIIEQPEFSGWLGGKAPAMIQKGFSGQNLLPEMAVYRVPDLVNDTSNNSGALIQPIPKLRDDD